ncbi:MAD2L1-binding protein isoform X2 [Fundulus heteroclitus]|uniref:MAD2L1-binding protein isoform X2 n=1 Tax=Fundulus heteroclitus TaxID=8078 RepID=UPI00165B858C|nr:MAD2L1-binding protein isoform X2 [Fundulus heteroclitus]
MAQHSDVLQLITNSDERESPCVQRGDAGSAGRPSAPSGRDIRIAEEPSVGCSLLRLCGDFDDSRSRAPSAEVHEDVRTGSFGTRSESKNAAVVKGVPMEEHRARNTGDKENSSEVVQDGAEEKMSGPDSCVTASRNNTSLEEQDGEVVRKAREEGRVDVVFPGAVTQDGCYRFVSEILKCVLYQRQQLPMTYEQLVYSQRQQQAAAQEREAPTPRPSQSADMDQRKRRQTLQELEEVLQQLEALFSLSRVPRVLLSMGGSVVLPKELYEINMEALALAAGAQSLPTSSCLKQLFRTLFVADLLSDTRPVRLMPTTVLALAHRECGVGWFRPKLQYRVPARVKHQMIALSTDPGACEGRAADEPDWQDYVWFQAPFAIKGYCI